MPRKGLLNCTIFEVFKEVGADLYVLDQAQYWLQRAEESAFASLHELLRSCRRPESVVVEQGRMLRNQS